MALSKFAEQVARICAEALVHGVDLSGVVLSDATRGAYYAAGDGRVALEWRICELIQAKLSDGSWVQFDLNGSVEISVMNLAAWTGQAWKPEPMPPVPPVSEEDPTQPIGRPAKIIGEAIANQPGRYMLLAPLPESGPLFHEDGKDYRIVAAVSGFGKMFVAELVK
jgi:hypothetical protein